MLFFAFIFTILAGIGNNILGISPEPPNLVTQEYNACYAPEPDTKITLTWPSNFTNVKDDRPTLNPALFSSVPPTFNTEAVCQNLVMNNLTTRNFIRVRQNVRIASCKTDELGGPFGTGTCPDQKGLAAQASRHRGMCSLTGYTDLRKVADLNQNGENLEIFWNPFSYNVGCNYKQDSNCGPGDRRNINLKDFVYVLRGRDAFDAQTRANCPIQWDAGSTNEEACSHYFDVYMAEDVYLALQSIPATEDPENPYYFLKQVVENCQENTSFIPAPEANLTMPPIFINKPFIHQNNTMPYSTDKIMPQTTLETTNYLTYIWGRADVMNPDTTNLLQASTSNGPFTFCDNTASPTQTTSALATSPTSPPPTIAPLSDCYDKLGKINLNDKSTNTLVSFSVYSKPPTPQTFTFFKDGNTTLGYEYTITDKDYPTNTLRQSSLQLRVMSLLTQNTWTWATPWCKPAIYLYPQRQTDMNVKLTLDGELTQSIPSYDKTHGWNVTAQPDGTLTTTGNVQPTTYPYLYYEANLNNVSIPQEGWVYPQNKLEFNLFILLSQIGFTKSEISDFMKYWLPRLQDKPYYFVTLLPENLINQKESLTFSKTPDTVIRVRVAFEGLDIPITVPSLKTIPHYERNGFVVADWGGTIVGKSCTDIAVK